MLDTQSKISTSVRNHDTTGWEEVSLTALNSRQKRRFQKHKDAIVAYFVTEASLDEIAAQQNISTLSLLAMVEKCLMHQEDGQVWGFRALLPGANVVDHTPLAAQETPVKSDASLVNDEEEGESTAKRPAFIVAEPIKRTAVLSLPETPCPAFDDEEAVDDSVVPEPTSPTAEDTVGVEDMTGASPVTTILSALLLESRTSIPIPTALTYTFPSLVEESSVGTDVSRPADSSTADEDAIHRSLQKRETSLEASIVEQSAPVVG